MSLKNPNITGTLRADGVTPGLTEEKILVVGQKVSAGTATSGSLQSDIGNDNSWNTLFGSDSVVAAAVRRVRARNTVTQVDVIAVDDAAGSTAATCTATLSVGTITDAKSATLNVGDDKDHKFTVAVVAGETATTLAAKFVTAIEASTTCLVSAASAAGVITLTSKNTGTIGNTIGVSFNSDTPDVTCVLTAMSGGVVDPNVTGIFDVIGEGRYQTVIWQFDNQLDEVTTFLDNRFNVTNNILDGRAFVGKTDTYANHLTTLNALNSRSLCVQVDKLVSTADYQGAGILDLPFIKAASFAAVRSLRRTENSVLGSVVIARSARDTIGGAWQNSKPYFNTPFTDLSVPTTVNRFTEVEVKALLDAGGYVLGANSAGNTVIAGELVTTYKTDAAGNDDPTFKLLNYVDTATAAREYIINAVRAKYPQYRATGGALLQGSDSVNEAAFGGFIAEKNQELGDLALVNTGVGTVDGVDVDYDKLFRENLNITLNTVTGTFLVDAKLYIVVQFRGATLALAVSFEV